MTKQRFYTVTVAVLLAVAAFAALGEESTKSGKLSWVGCGITKASLMDQLAVAYHEKTGVEISIAGGGSTRGIRAVASGEASLGGTCRHPLDVPEEREARVVPIAWDAVVVVTHRDNPIDSMTSAQTRQVFSGAITEWKDLGAPGLGKINVYVREGRLSGVGYMSRIMVFSDAEADYVATHVFRSTEPLELALEEDPRGVAFTGISSAKVRNLKVLKIDGVSPSFGSILDGTYPFVRPLFLTFREGTTDETVLDFIDWARSDEGQSKIMGTEVVPIALISGETWERYNSHMEKAKQDTAALQRILEDLADE